jgi:cyclophilin family peptidyl-prolyl cis-trans isomerase
VAQEFPPADGSAPKTQRFSQAPAMGIDLSKRHTAEMVTTKGTMIFALDAITAPRTVNNFVFLARYHYFDGIFFHRVIPGFMCQGGDPEGTGTGGPGYRFEDELPSAGRYQIGSLAMANAGPNTNGSQFFITHIATDWLDGKHTVFGQVTSGQDVVDKVQQGDQLKSVTVQEG